MSDYIPQSEIEQMSEQELRAKISELFNALAQKQQSVQESEEIKAALQRVRIALFLRQIKPPGI